MNHLSVVSYTDLDSIKKIELWLHMDIKKYQCGFKLSQSYCHTVGSIMNNVGALWTVIGSIDDSLDEEPFWPKTKLVLYGSFKTQLET